MAKKHHGVSSTTECTVLMFTAFALPYPKDGSGEERTDDSHSATSGKCEMRTLTTSITDITTPRAHERHFINIWTKRTPHVSGLQMVVTTTVGGQNTAPY
uniref:Secreted protein n=1 Tax=Ascaris lumbricoides TaxID=6252 RepID=A0A0M3HQ44_ASCLU